MTKYFAYSDIFCEIKTIDVVRETEYFLVVQYKTPGGVLTRKEKKISECGRWFPTIEEALKDASKQLNKELVDEFRQHSRRVIISAVHQKNWLP